MTSNFSYRKDIDGLRAVAVLPVVLYHAGFQIFSGGYVGVDVFFVISGYLITSIILSEISNANFSIRDFYARRVRRLFPALFAVVFACLVPAYWLLMPEELEDFGQSVATAALFSSNFMFWSEAGYFEGPAELKPLLHTWSLAIEEQYYLLFPGLLLLIHRYGGGRFLAWTLGIFALSLTISIWSVANHPSAAFYLLPSRTWELLLGSLLAIIGRDGLAAPRSVNEVMGWLGLGLIGVAVFAYEPDTTFPGLAALLPCLGTVALIQSGKQETTTIGRLLGWRPLVFVGLISYSLYLWHWPILVFAKHYLVRPLETPEALLGVAASIGMAVLCWHFVEKPFRGKQGLFSTTGLFRAAGVAMAFAIGVGLLFDNTDGLPGRLSPDVANIAAVALDKPPERKQCEGIDPAEISFERLCRVNESGVAPSFVFWGDSHAAMLMRAARATSLELGTNGINATSNGCAPLLGVARVVRGLTEVCIPYNQKILDLIEAHPELTTVVLFSRWASYAEGQPYGAEGGERGLLTGPSYTATSLDENHRLFTESLRDTIQALKKLGRRVVVLGPTPEAGIDVPNEMAKSKRRGLQRTFTVSVQDFEKRQAAVFSALNTIRKDTPYELALLHPLFCNEVQCDLSEGGLPIYFDDDHLSSVGADRTAPLFKRVLQPLHQVR